MCLRESRAGESVVDSGYIRSAASATRMNGYPHTVTCKTCSNTKPETDALKATLKNCIKTFNLNIGTLTNEKL